MHKKTRTEGRQPCPTRARWILAGILVLAGVLRLLFLKNMLESGFLDGLVLDARYFWEQADQLASNGLDSHGFFWRPPLYILFVAAHIRFLGSSIVYPLLTQFVLSVLSLLLLYGTAIRVTARRTALLATFLLAINSMHIYYTSQLLMTTLFTFLLLATLHALVRSSNRRATWLFLGGISAGATLLVRTTLLPTIGGWMLWILLQKGSSRRQRSQAMLAFVAGLALLYAPYVVFQHQHSGAWMLTPPLGGYNLFVGNNRASDGKTVWASEQALGKTNIRDATPTEGNRRYIQATMAEIEKDPAHFVRGLMRKCFFLVNNFEISSNSDIYHVIRVYAPWLRPLQLISFGVLLAFAVTGLCFGTLRRKSASPLLICLVCFPLTLVLFFINARFRVPIIPVLCLLGASGMVAMLEHAKKGSFPVQLWLPFVLVIGLTAYPFFQVSDPMDTAAINRIQASKLFLIGRHRESLHLIEVLEETAPNEPLTLRLKAANANALREKKGAR